MPSTRSLLPLALLGCLTLTLLSPTARAQDGRRLDSFGDISTPQAAQQTLKLAIDQLVKSGGGVLIVPPEAPEALRIENRSQADRDSVGVTIIDQRRGFVETHVPPAGKLGTGGWAGQRVRRELNLTPQQSRLAFQGLHAAQMIQNFIVSGSSSYMACLTRPTTKGKDQRVYVDLIRGIYPQQYLTITSSVVGYAPPYDRVIVKSIGWDAAARCAYFVTDLEHDHPAGALVYNKHVVNGLQLESYSNGDNQTMDLQVTRHAYGVGDSFVISGHLHYMSDIFSGFGDEGAVVLNAEVVGDINGFRGVVESVDPANHAIVYQPGKVNAHTLASSRPLVNMNPAKWITKGQVYVVSPEGSWKGMKFPGHVGGHANVFNFQGGAILAAPDCGWTEEVVGRFFALTDPTESIMPEDGAAGYAAAAEKPVHRWYQVVALETLPDGWKRIKILRVRWSAPPAGAPKLFRDDNYTRDGQERPLSYAIAPGAWVYDISQGWDDASGRGGLVYPQHPRRLRVTPSGDSGTAMDFQPGDAIEQPPGPDPYQPQPLRIRQFDQMPSTMDTGTVLLCQYGRVQVPYAFVVTSNTHRVADIAKRKDQKPPFDTIMRIMSVADRGLLFQGTMREAAIQFNVPDSLPQRLRWMRDDGGQTDLYVQPTGAGRGDVMIQGGGLNLGGGAVASVGGLSATATPARNLRGINLPVPAGATRLEVTFPVPEADADYALSVQANWFTQDRVVQKRTTGFIVEFSAAATADALIDWQLVR